MFVLKKEKLFSWYAWSWWISEFHIHYKGLKFALQQTLVKKCVEPISEGGAPISEEEVCKDVLGRRTCYIVGHGWGPKPKSHFSEVTSNEYDSFTSQVTEIVEAQKAEIQAARDGIETQK